MKNILRVCILGIIGILGLGSSVNAAPVQHWYSPQQVQQGEVLFKQNCAVCHGQNAEATPNWKETDANGIYPPPPLNGTAHAWHHDLELLRKTVREGGQKLGGVMPPFEGRLDAEQVDAVIAYFQSKWPDELYQKWSDRFIAQAELPSISSASQSASAQPDSNKKITRLLQQRLGLTDLDAAQKTALDGVWQVKYNDRYIYLIEQGDYAFIGDFIDLKKGRNLTELDRRASTVEVISSFSDADKIIFPAIGQQKARLTVFTDTSCAYCQKLHEEVPFLQQAGIAVAYLPFARGGQQGPGYQTLKSVWCASDRNQAMTDAKKNKTAGLPGGSCDQASIVDKAYQAGNDLGISGTPALFKSNGELIQGYVPHQQLITRVLGQ